MYQASRREIEQCLIHQNKTQETQNRYFNHSFYFISS